MAKHIQQNLEQVCKKIFLNNNKNKRDKNKLESKKGTNLYSISNKQQQKQQRRRQIIDSEQKWVSFWSFLEEFQY